MTYICSLASNPQALKDLELLYDKIWCSKMPPSKSAYLIPRIISSFSEYVLLAYGSEIKDELMAYAVAIPFKGPEDINDLPDSGYDGVLHDAFVGLDKKIKPSMLCAISITVDPKFRGLNLSVIMAKSLTKLTKDNGFKNLVVPIRPPGKANEIEMDMMEYAKKLQLDGEPFDYWIRLHYKLGARIIKICYNSMVMSYDIGTWEKITGLKFTETKNYIIPDALAPLEVQYEKNIATMHEPNVWMRYEL